MLQKFKKIDIPIVLILLALLTASIFLVYSATYNDQKIDIEIKKMLIISVVSLVAFLFVSMIDYRELIKLSPYLYGFGVLLLVAVYLFGVEKNGAKGWFQLPFGGLDFQPVELVKLILIVALAAFMARREGEKLTLVRDVIPIGAMALLPFALVAIQPDLGNALILLAIVVGMFWIGNIRISYVLIGLAVAVGGLYLFVFLFKNYHDALVGFFEALKVPGHWLDRLNTYINPETATRDDKWQVENSMRAIGSGGLLGEKYLQGTSVQSSFIPFAYSDSIFVVVGEEFGFVGASCLLLLYFVLIYRMILISINSNMLSGSYIIIGIVSMLVFQIFENVGMMIGIMPLTGITLPFISYGGSSLLINMMAMGLVMSIKLHNDKPIEEI